MQVTQLYTKCLAQGAYFISSNGEAAVIDPLRETEPYIKLAAENGVKIKYIFETHFHADFVSGHIDLAKETGATIVYGPTAVPSFDAYVAKDNEVFKVGDLSVAVLHTPGHTMESSTFLLRDADGKDQALFTGDTLFLGDVGRPDLAQKAANMTREELAGLLFDSLREKIMVLSDDLIVYPGHGQGSACGKAMSSDTVDTLGNQKATNYALRANMTRDEFIKEVTDGLLAPPSYFPKNAAMNKFGYESIKEIQERGTKALSVEEFAAGSAHDDAVILDARDANTFVKGFIPGAFSIGISGDFAPWVGIILTDIKAPIYLVVDENMVDEAVVRLARVGYDNVQGYLKGGVEAWKNSGKEVATIKSATPQAFINDAHKMPVVDVRRTSEFNVAHVDEARNIPLDFIYSRMQDFPKKPFYIHCQGGYRSVIAASVLAKNGVEVVNIEGGYDGLVKAGQPMVEMA